MNVKIANKMNDALNFGGITIVLKNGVSIENFIAQKVYGEAEKE